MADQYFTRRPAARSRRFEFTAVIRDETLRLVSDSGVFSKSRIDRGTALLAEAMEIRPGETILDLGCGIGALGIALAKATPAVHVWMTDLNERGVALASENARRNGVEDRVTVRSGPFYGPVPALTFDHIATNPPIRAGRPTVTRMIREAPDHLVRGGSLWLVARTRQGAQSLQALMQERFGRAEIVARGGGYKVIRSSAGARELPSSGDKSGPP